jgi:G:T-mismatch repair DNA endonuclease (very short patch repair protein)
MTDHLDKAEHSWNMSRIRGKNTKPEIAVRKVLHAARFRCRLHARIFPVSGKQVGAVLKMLIMPPLQGRFSRRLAAFF